MATSAHTDDRSAVETAHLAGLSVRSVEKSSEKDIVFNENHMGYLVKLAVFHVPTETVVYTSA